jgi:trimethylamine--corrinoid protein Co-methyltransferase
MNHTSSRWQPTLTLMTPERIDQLHEEALNLLSQVGLNVHHTAMREQLKKAGAALGEGARTFLSPEMVEQALASVKKEVIIHDRQGEPVMPLGAHQIYFGTGSDLIYTYDPESGAHRESTLADVGRAAKLCDALDDIDFVMSFALPQDVPNEDAEPQQYYTLLQNTTKPVIMTSFSGLEAYQRMHQMACLIAGGDEAFRKRPNYIMYGQFVSPLEHDHQAIERLIFCADHEVPLIYVPTIMSGASGPLTMYGSLALALAETLGGLVMHQLQRPGAPFVTGACVSPLNMKTGLFPYGTPEWRLNDLVMAEMSRHYGIPVFGTGGATDSKLVDAQTGGEYASSLLAAALSGTNLIHDVGYLNSGLTGSLESIVLGADLIRWVKRFVGGFGTRQDDLAENVIAEVGPAGEFLSHDHTFQHLSGVWRPHALDHKDYDTWQAEGAQDYAQRARSYALETLADHEVKELDKDLQPKLDALRSSPR